MVSGRTNRNMCDETIPVTPAAAPATSLWFEQCCPCESPWPQRQLPSLYRDSAHFLSWRHSSWFRTCRSLIKEIQTIRQNVWGIYSINLETGRKNKHERFCVSEGGPTGPVRLGCQSPEVIARGTAWRSPWTLSLTRGNTGREFRTFGIFSTEGKTYTVEFRRIF